MAACGLDVPGKRTPRGVAHLRYACVVCALTSASRCSPGRDEHQLVRGAAGGPAHRASRCATLFAPGAGAPTGLRHPGGGFTAAARSEEHTSELQSRPHLVCRLLLEKKKPFGK